MTRTEDTDGTASEVPRKIRKLQENSNETHTMSLPVFITKTTQAASVSMTTTASRVSWATPVTIAPTRVKFTTIPLTFESKHLTGVQSSLSNNHTICATKATKDRTHVENAIQNDNNEDRRCEKETKEGNRPITAVKHSASQKLTDIVRLALGSESKHKQFITSNSTSFTQAKVSFAFKNINNCMKIIPIKQVSTVESVPVKNNTILSMPVSDVSPRVVINKKELPETVVTPTSVAGYPKITPKKSETEPTDIDLNSMPTGVNSKGLGAPPVPTVIIPNAYMIQNGLQRTFDMASFQPISDDSQQTSSASSPAEDELEDEFKVKEEVMKKDLNNIKVKNEREEEKKKDTDSASVAQRLKLLRQKNQELMTSQMFTTILQKWEEYLNKTPDEMKDYELENALKHNYNKEAIEMLSDRDLYVWQVIDDLTPDLNFDLLYEEDFSCVC